MPEGTRSYKGLAVPLYGESEIQQETAATDILTITGASGMSGDFLVLQDSSGTEVVQIRSDGRLRLNTTSSSQNTLDVYFTQNVNMSAQSYAATFKFDQAGFAMDGGRAATLNLWFDYNSGGADVSFINFDSLGTDVPTLFTILNATVDSSLFVNTAAAAADHGLRIYVDNVVYYIMLSNTTAA